MADVATFSWKPNWASKLKESLKDNREYETLGRSRGVTVKGSSKTVRFSQEGTFQLVRDDLRELLAFWRARRGQWESFKAPSMITPGTASTAAPHAFDDLATVGLMRFSSEKIPVKWLNGNLAEVTLVFTQDIGGVTTGSYVYLYRFSCEDVDAGRNVEYLTEWCSSVTYDGHTWTPARIQHEEVTEDVEPQKEKCKLKLDIADSALVAALVKRELDSNVLGEIIELNLDTGAASTYFAGRVGKIERKGNIIQPYLQLWGGIFGRQLPPVSKSRTCPYCLFSAGCARLNPTRMAKANWASQGAYSGYFDTTDGRKYKLTGLVPDAKYTAFCMAYPNTANDGIRNWGYWSGGMAVTGSGTNRQVRPVIFSAQKTDGEVHIIPLRKFREGGNWLNEGDAVTVYPGCDGSYSACTNKLGNGDAFIGQYATPAYIEEASASSASSSGK